MAKPTAQQCHALTTYFVSKCAEGTGKTPVVNRNKARWGFESILMDYTPEQARVLVDYYVDHYERPNIEWFLYNYDKVDVAKQEHDTVELSRSKRRQETKERLEQWRKRWQQ